MEAKDTLHQSHSCKEHSHKNHCSLSSQHPYKHYHAA